jgi:hypothetical protein
MITILGEKGDASTDFALSIFAFTSVALSSSLLCLIFFYSTRASGSSFLHVR